MSNMQSAAYEKAGLERKKSYLHPSQNLELPLLCNL